MEDTRTNYIPADKLKAEIKRQQRRLVLLSNEESMRRDCALQNGVYILILSIIDSLQQEQPEVDLEKEFNDFLDNIEGMPRMWHSDEQIEWGKDIARHFHGLRNRALEEAARHAYESWMGGTMDDVRRDIVELGKVLNAKKK